MNVIIQAYLDRNINAHLHDLILSDRERVLLTGDGRLFFDRTGMLKLEICAPPPEGIDCERPPDGDAIQYSFRGELPQFISRIVGKTGAARFNSCPDKKHCMWIFDVWEIDIVTEQYLVAPSKIIAGMSSPCSVALTFELCTVDEARKFFDDTTRAQFVSLSIGDVEYGLRRTNQELLEASMVFPLGADVEQPQKFVDAVCKAISLYWGLRKGWLFVFTRRGSLETVSFSPWREKFKHREEWPYPLTSNLVTKKDGPFKQALQYYLSGDRYSLDEYMGLFWESGPSFSLQVREPVLGAAIEGLSKAILREHKEASDAFKAAEKAAEKLAEKAVTLLKKDTDITASEYFEPLKSHMRYVQALVAKKRIRAAAEAIELTLTDDSVDAWARMRNNAAHATKVQAEIESSRIEDFEICANLLNDFASAILDSEEIQSAEPDSDEDTVSPSAEA